MQSTIGKRISFFCLIFSSVGISFIQFRTSNKHQRGHQLVGGWRAWVLGAQTTVLLLEQQNKEYIIITFVNIDLMIQLPVCKAQTNFWVLHFYILIPQLLSIISDREYLYCVFVFRCGDWNHRPHHIGQIQTRKPGDLVSYHQIYQERNTNHVPRF